MMKYVALHSENFQNPGRAFFMGAINALVIVLVEIINLWNLSNITEGGTYSLMFDFIALGIIAEFDDYFIEIYRYSNISYLISSLTLVFENTVMPKRNLPNLREVRIERLMIKIRDKMKEFRDLCSESNTRNLPKVDEADAAEVSYCEGCYYSCRNACCRSRRSQNWHRQAQVLLSKAIIQIVMLLRLKVKIMCDEQIAAKG
mmetsp:Transcript_23671/g.29330  ORF Transcript_23671/g.29330 Transcript_23671/m.29330 type:complete len:202 (+) Transcript_23671:2098-2703(+)|eukprot:CAMPEP_0170457910 /NCGR_PEP_ID=MMETSP0123-20130129/5043_1 /TAXON_ID=182087 /ORGANISM="Favella ehrenbergii, Strain Fehren 1" /LENGTH=201 /DNA_ID=CAMNT_0010721857 /DNA_START=1854 /DNA_END=2459 /DNA_ORIENTATION=-